MADITAIGFQQQYDDGSGPRLEVTFDAHHKNFAGDVILYAAGDFITVKPSDLDWLIEALSHVRTVSGRLSQHKED